MNRDDTELEQLGLTAPDDHELAWSPEAPKLRSGPDWQPIA
jgi:hypothetical protein